MPRSTLGKCSASVCKILRSATYHVYPGRCSEMFWTKVLRRPIKPADTKSFSLLSSVEKRKKKKKTSIKVP